MQAQGHLSGSCCFHHWIRSGHLGHWHLTALDAVGFYTLHCSLLKWPSKCLRRPGICAIARATELQCMNRDYVMMRGQQVGLVSDVITMSEFTAVGTVKALLQLWLTPVLVCFLHACLCLPAVRGVTNQSALFSNWTLTSKLVLTLSLSMVPLLIHLKALHWCFPSVSSGALWLDSPSFQIRQPPACVVSPRGHREV